MLITERLRADAFALEARRQCRKGVRENDVAYFGRIIERSDSQPSRRFPLKQRGMLFSLKIWLTMSEATDHFMHTHAIKDSKCFGKT